MEHKGKIQAEGIVSARLMVDMDVLIDLQGQSGISSYNFPISEEDVDALLDCRYNKIMNSWKADRIRDIWNYDGYEDNREIRLYIYQGNHFNEHYGYVCVKDKSNNTWGVTFSSI